MSQKTIRVTYYRSAIGYSQDQKDTIRALGFRRLNQTLEKPDNPSVRGMIYKVRHLVRIEGEDES
ncbi:50S ribosomal protein L30 [Sphaerobacter thermophilus]|jgi:large subunit ribosomal protein L30|uniref:50S ribosomal protein L30 n=1 Tax=Sphaerobacter thermophilus (strain ATCC 49802 / DSM 20745 / KCCM 41009 / NCIMB 13125 / S 6022) TaxID=479434 RepID=D1C2M3_SPHTD|nr:50S ribosomal protein L30 [Sphaerobacter thermophilus]ACZ38490.1 ribosomal protein L30 [Sphaerobacter thermophilus DSM 20745]PZN68006.1 MAG: 50S ribosomal protein L30 [Sphaerobacter thermophilus]